jgi:hypothetical protein
VKNSTQSVLQNLIPETILKYANILTLLVIEGADPEILGSFAIVKKRNS